MKKSILFLGVILLFCLTSCIRSLEELVPKDGYQEWDGKYFYYGNYKSKSTGENEEKLIEEFELNGVLYVNCTHGTGDYCINDGYMSFILCCHKENEGCWENLKSVLVIYSIEEEKVIKIFDCDKYNFQDILYTDSEKVIIISWENVCYIFDVASEELIVRNINVEMADPICDGKHLVFYNRQEEKMSLHIIDLETFNEEVKWFSNNKVENYVIKSIDGNKILEIIFSKTEPNENDPNRYIVYNGLSIYNFANKKVYNILDIEDKKNVVSTHDEYYVIGKMNTNLISRYMKYSYLVDENILYKMSISNQDIKMEEKYKFQLNNEYKIVQVYAEEMVLHQYEYRKFNGERISSLSMNLNSNIITKLETYEYYDYDWYYSFEINAETYIIKRSLYSEGFMHEDSAYTLYKLDQGNLNLLQFYPKPNSSVQMFFYLDQNIEFNFWQSWDMNRLFGIN